MVVVPVEATTVTQDAWDGTGKSYGHNRPSQHSPRLAMLVATVLSTRLFGRDGLRER